MDKNTKSIGWSEYQEEKFQHNENLKMEYDKLEVEFIIARMIIELRLASNMSQAELADKIGTKQSKISLLEGGQANPRLDMLKRVADGFGKKLHVTFE